MRIETFRMERMQCTYESEVDYNLSESGVLPQTIEELLSPEQISSLNGGRSNHIGDHLVDLSAVSRDETQIRICSDRKQVGLQRMATTESPPC